MSFGFFGQDQPPVTQATSFNPEDQEKHDKIVKLLCEKRKALEWNLKNRKDGTEENYEAQLKEHIEKMEVFGISERDYAIFLAKEPEETVH